MSRRNPLNDRYTTEKNMQGVSRKSAASAKPKAKAGESTTGTMSAAQAAERKKMSRKERKEAEQAELEQLGPRARERRLRAEYNKWDVWRRRMVMLSFVLLFVALAYPFSVTVEDYNQVLGWALWSLPFIAIGIGIYMSYAKQRPIGRVLGIKYGREGRDERDAETREKREKMRREYNMQEQKVDARVREKEERTEQREKRRAENRAAEEARMEQYKAAGQAKNKKKSDGEQEE